MAALYHGPKRGVHLAYLAYAMYGRCTGASVWLANYFLKIKIVCGSYPDLHGRAKAPPPHAALHKLVGTHFTMQVSGHTLYVALHNARGRTGARPGGRVAGQAPGRVAGWPVAGAGAGAG